MTWATFLQLLPVLTVALASAYAVSRTTGRQIQRDTMATLETALAEARTELKSAKTSLRTARATYLEAKRVCDADMAELRRRYEVLRQLILAHERGEDGTTMADIERRFAEDTH